MSNPVCVKVSRPKFEFNSTITVSAEISVAFLARLVRLLNIYETEYSICFEFEKIIIQTNSFSLYIYKRVYPVQSENIIAT